MRKSLIAACAVMALVVARPAPAALITYTAPTGQTATADFSFVNATTLRIILTETTPAAVQTAGGISGADAILTGVAFNLPVNISTGAVVISTGSTSVGFQIGPTPMGPFGGGTDVSHEYGATLGTDRHPQDTFEPFGPTQQVSTIGYSGITQLAGTNLDGPDVLSGPQAGLLANSAIRGGQGVIDDSATITLTLASALTAQQQADFLAGLNSGSFVIFGSHFAVGTPNGLVVPEPSSLMLAGLGLLTLAGYRWKRRQAAAA